VIDPLGIVTKPVDYAGNLLLGAIASLPSVPDTDTLGSTMRGFFRYYPAKRHAD
jgi:hypothetical protein